MSPNLPWDWLSAIYVVFGDVNTGGSSSSFNTDTANVADDDNLKAEVSVTLQETTTEHQHHYIFLHVSVIL